MAALERLIQVVTAPSGRSGRDTGPSSVTLHSSWRGIGFATLGMLLLALLAFGMVRADLGWVGIAVAVFAVVCALVVLFDMPVASTFDRDGVVRRTPLRRHRLRWENVERLMRSRTIGRGSPSARRGGLIAVNGIRQTLLVDRAEGRSEHEALLAAVGDEVAAELFDDVEPPPENRMPTWTYRRKRWRPDSAPTR